MLPLQGLRIIAVEQYGAGPFGTLQLADLGAEVIKVENPRDGGDTARYVGPFHLGDDDSDFFQSFNRNKRSITLDLKQPGAREVLHALAKHADALLDNLRGDLPARLGLTYAALKDANPRIVCVHLSAYGREGSRAHWPGYDYLMQAEAGYLMLTGEPDGPPARMGLSVVDYMTGLFAGLGLLSGVIAARAAGQGRDVDVSLFDCAMQNLSYLATWYLNEGHVQRREARSSHPSITPSQLYRTGDGWIFLMCNKEKFWTALCDVLERPPLRRSPCQPRYAHRAARRGARPQDHGGMARGLCRPRPGGAGERSRRRAGKSVFARARPHLAGAASRAAGFPHAGIAGRVRRDAAEASGAGARRRYRRRAARLRLRARAHRRPAPRRCHLGRRRRRMTYDEFNAFCRALPAATYVVQWGGSHVWKVGGKVFAIGGWQDDDEAGFTFKVTKIAYEMLRTRPGLRPAPYLASRGMTWIQHFAKPGLSDRDLKEYIRHSHLIVARGLSKKKQSELGLIER
jgi:crotonobetainyl-CoA:carnitine CoA-transferase CaiB-like acyl-CoA transferase/predicted DNA-binding protein (MmcQ/YjbR family)